MALPAQSTPGFVAGQVPTPAAWNNAFAGKIDASVAGVANGVAPLDSTGLVPTANLPAAQGAVPLAGGTMTGALILSGSPTQPAQAATKEYVDSVLNGVIYGSLTTTNATPVAIPGLPTIPSAGGKVSIQGQIGAYDTTTGDTAEWNVALVVKRVPTALNCAVPAGADTTPSQFYPPEGALSSIPAPALTAGQNGPVITLTGIASTTILFDYNLTFSEAYV